ncbi:uncharacterized protein G2W53_022819 [Senna tora]|uniref:Uncharacterized protein n=1 Tax=Senna tora TaxID=362788 RepID=A0A834WIM5_9FABA|nr:uncharacterized protein G2W53_022819 [Senna tora]
MELKRVDVVEDFRIRALIDLIKSLKKGAIVRGHLIKDCNENVDNLDSSEESNNIFGHGFVLPTATQRPWIHDCGGKPTENMASQMDEYGKTAGKLANSTVKGWFYENHKCCKEYSIKCKIASELTVDKKNVGIEFKE